MKLTYKGTAYLFDPNELSYPEAIAFQGETRMKIGQWLDGLGTGDIACMMAAVWLCLWRDGDKTLKFRDLIDDPNLRPLKDIGIESDDEPDAEVVPAGPDPTDAIPDSSPSTESDATSSETSTEAT